MRLTNPDRVLYAEQGLTKRDLLRHYERVAERMLPHVKGRPLTLVRCPRGRAKGCFFQKHVDKTFPEALTRVEVREKEKKAVYAAADTEEAILSLVQMGVLEIHTWGSRRESLEKPDLAVFDLDPGDGAEWKDVARAARDVRAELESRGETAHAKTTGGKGLHVVVPLAPAESWDSLKAWAREVAEAVSKRDPGRYTTTMSKARRKGKVFVDWLRNARGATFVAPYSTRARPGAPVAVPVRWDEIGNIRGDRWTVRNLPRRLAALKTEPWPRGAY